MLSFIALSAALLSATGVSAHGYTEKMHVGGMEYSGYLPWSDPYESPAPQRIVRKIPGDGPIENVNDAALACNVGGDQGANTVADFNAGDEISFTWNTWPSDHAGPITISMADCNGDCKSFNTNGAQWFKIDQEGWSNGQWATDKFIANGATWTTNIPAELKNGEYLVRMEIVALHSTGKPQFYPSCAQVNVKNGGGKSASGNDLFSIPGLYSGYQFPDIWSTNEFSGFKVAGPALASLASGGGNNNNNGGSNNGNNDDDDNSEGEESSSASSPTPTTRENNDAAASPTFTIETTNPEEPSATSAPENDDHQGSCRRRRKRSLEKKTTSSTTTLTRRKGNHLNRFARHAASSHHRRSH